MGEDYRLIDWKDYPNISTPIMASNLNHMDGEIGALRTETNIQTTDISQLKVQKANNTDLLQAVQSVTMNLKTGVLTITHFNGNVITFDTSIEKIATNFRVDDDPSSPHYMCLVITLDDGSYQYVDLTTILEILTFGGSDRIQVTKSGNNYTFDIKRGSITSDYLDTNYLAQITANMQLAEQYATNAHLYSDAAVQASTAATAAAGNAANSATSSANSALVSEGYAVGKQNGQDVDSSSPYYENNAKYYNDNIQTLIAGKQDQLTIELENKTLVVY